MNYQNPTLRRALAADYAIGLMPPTARRRFEQLMADDRELQVELARWQETLVSLTAPIVEKPVPEQVWNNILARIEPQRLHMPRRSRRRGLLMAAAAVVLAVAIGMLYDRDPAHYRATLVSAGDQAAVNIVAHEHYLQVEPVALASAPADRSMELWAIPASGTPISLGLMPEGGKGKISLNESQRKLFGEPIALAISLEPAGGSPTGQPTGPVLYQGKVQIL
ncbi:anti-sigma-K factor RskA family protein [Pseudomonas sp. M47T1]|uniref:anti-sigma factor n=1 Tax=unclassified Pseudomonas TaxID=196821 RepID=UPI00026066E7|nr:anti-sigma factor [Pseudomonas sp. M47T1]EIK98654.1 anti-sigma-K factor RskA family protein [Pseudomonas sp. M47T1]